jgi:hypothetical protein
VIEGGLVRTSANCGIDASWMVLIMMLAEVRIAVMMKLVMNDASFFKLAKAVYAACSQ